ncbi:MAG: hypothetical protein KF887_16740 [Paracoccaceae bacterium]|nr:MAG: hypothetical protein KF887_16740 [Paracoccaceae bacterium]
MRLAVLCLACLPFAAQAESPVASSFMLSGASVWDTTGEPDVRALAERDRISKRGDGDFVTISSMSSRQASDNFSRDFSLDAEPERAGTVPPARVSVTPRRSVAPVRAADTVPAARSRKLGPWQTGIYQ